MQSWLVTVPKTIKWKDYLDEIKDAKEKKLVLNYRVAYLPKEMKHGDRLYICHNGYIRGYMPISQVIQSDETWKCAYTGTLWGPGVYIQRTGEFVSLKELVPHPGFRGIRKIPTYE